MSHPLYMWLNNRRLSHYEMYLDAMQHIGADVTAQISSLKSELDKLGD